MVYWSHDTSVDSIQRSDITTTHVSELSRGFALAAGQARTITSLGITITYRIPNEATGGAGALLEYSVPPHFAGPSLHRHAYTTELFYILEGTLALTLGEETITATPGASAYIAPGVVHTFFNPTAERVKFLIWITPGDFAEYFNELFALIQAEPSWPPADPQKLATLIAKYDLQAPPAPGME
jgi:mannose-6-phosphate isomerase-like protein (cupin superfamily)